MSNDLTIAQFELISCLLGGCGEGQLVRLGWPGRAGCGALTGEGPPRVGRAAWRSRHWQGEQGRGEGVAGGVGGGGEEV